ncbi:MAG: hypothetical protein HGB03_01930 [Candidatus Yonathbacteria bacterium]|nr:hypothetical protein [Candidatus Yonathbacteria bacterium]NTW48018.1 hypothetical protein [Candidatus Yonathbacteria bacterium]
MKKLLFLFGFLCFLYTGCAQEKDTASPLTKEGDMYTLVITSKSAWDAHMSVNTFANEVGKTLKSSFPAKVMDPDVHVRVFRDDTGKTHYRVSCSCRIVPARKGETPDCYFDRRGALISGKTPEKALTNADAEIRDSRKIEDMRRRFPHGVIPDTFVRTSFSGSSHEGYWAIKEYFIVGPKP